MTLLERFNSYLRENGRSDLTAKNYESDARRFIYWVAKTKTLPDPLSSIESDDVKKYKLDLRENLDPRSQKRHSSSLNQFFVFLTHEGIIASKDNIVHQEESTNSAIDQQLKADEFSSFLRENLASTLTVKNYLADVRQFVEWFMKVSSVEINQNPTALFTNLRREVIQTYKDRLLLEKGLSPVSINRKLSSLRAYLKFATKYGLIDQNSTIPENASAEMQMTTSEYASLFKPQTPQVDTDLNPSPASFAPSRMLNRVKKVAYLLVDTSIITPLAEGFLVCQKLIWKTSGGRLFFDASKKPLRRTRIDSFIVDSFQKSFYAPLSLAYKDLPLFRRLILLLRYHRPLWYKRYHTYAFVHYVHFGLLGISIILMGSILYQRIAPSLEPHVLGNSVIADGRKLQFRGQLLDSNNSPLSGIRPIRFSLYDDSIASGSSLLWEDVTNVKADSKGDFLVTLGDSRPLPNELFASGQNLYLGIAVENTDELKPRQPIPNVHLAEDSTRLSGMLPTTDQASGGTNAVLALDSAGNLTIGHNSSPIFQATDGSFTLRAKELVFQTLPKSNGNITLSPDGYGIVGINKPIQNTSEYGSTPQTLGAVEVADAFAILASESGRSAFSINQNGSGPLISASSSGIAKFYVDNTGSGYFSGNVTLDGTDLSTNQFAINLFNRNAQIINLGGQSIAVTIGSQSGTTTIRTPSTNLEGNLTVGGPKGLIFTSDNTGISFSGSGVHSLKADSGTLQIGSQLELSKDTSFLPSSSDGTNNLGSADRPFDTIYVNNIISSGLNGQQFYWNSHDGINHPLNISNDIIIGGSATSSAAWQVFGSGNDKGTASSSGGLSFSGQATNINQFNGGSLSFLTSSGGSSGLTKQMTITTQGIGIGTNAPSVKFDVQDTRSGTATAMINNLSTAANTSALDLKLGGTGTGNSFLRFMNGNGEIIGSIQDNGSNVFYNGGYFISSGSDFAEYFLKHDPDEPFAPGNIVCLHKEGGVTKCSNEQTSIVGVVSDRPSFIGNSSKQHDAAYVLVGLQGQVPVTVSDENGPIRQSDSLTFSATPGIAAKAIGPAPIVGQALEKQETETGRINSYIRPGWFDPTPHSFSTNGNLQFSLQKAPENTEGTNNYIVKQNDGSILNATAAFSDAVIGNLIIGLITAKDISTEVARVTGQLIAKTIHAENITLSGNIISPLASIDTLRTHILSPLSDKDGLSLVFQGETIALVDPVSSKAAITFDRDGNASLSGKLASSSLSVQEDATIGGTLRVKKLIADEIVGQQSATNAATYVTNITNVYTSSQTATLTPTPMQTGNRLAADNNESTVQTSSLLNDTLATNFMPSSSISGALATTTTGNVSFDFATIASGLMVFGPSSFSDISAAGQIAIGGNLVLSEGGINTLGRSLELQPLRQGNLSIMGGLLTIDTSGNLLALGNASFAKDVTVMGTLSASIIAPVPESDLVVSLNKAEGAMGTRSPSFIVTDSSGSAKFKVSDIGDIIASGSGRFLRLMTENLNLIRGAQADTSVRETVASSSAGTATINKGQKDRTIITPFVSENSLIYLTPTSDTYGVTPYVSRQTPEDTKEKTKGSFTIEVTRPVTGDINLNWWIIN